jgi:hypothetical protein
MLRNILRLVLAMTILICGCGGGDGDGNTTPTPTAKYDIQAGFMDAAKSKSFIAIIERLDQSAESAKSATVTVDGTTVPLATGSTDDEAIYRSDAITYSEGTTYSVAASIGSQSATASITAPTACTVTLLTPAVNGTFTPGEAISVTWEYDDKGAPPEVFVEVMAGSTSLIDVEITGSTTSYTIPGSTTSGWSSHDSIVLLIAAGETTAFSGDMASSGSESYVLLSSDLVTLTRYEEGEVGSYTLSSLFMVNDDTGISVSALISVSRNNTSDTGANEAVVTVNGSAITQLPGGTADDAIWIEDLPYSLNQAFNVSVTIGGVTSTTSVVGYDRNCKARITSPATNSEYTVGTNIDLTWSYTGSNPDQIVIAAASGDSFPELFAHTASGSTTSYSVPTTGWTGASEVILGITVSANSTWSGNLADNDSGSGIIYTVDFIYLHPAGQGPGDDYYVYTSTVAGMIEPGGSTAVTAEVLNLEDDSPCPDGTVVAFVFAPEGMVTPSASTATTTNGIATITVTAGTTEGDVSITASALGDSDGTSLTIGSLSSLYYVTVTSDPALPEGEETYPLPANGSAQVTLNLRIVNLDDPNTLYTGATTINFQSIPTGKIVISPEQITTSDGTAQVIIQAGTTGYVGLIGILINVDQEELPPGVIISGSAFGVTLVAP